MARDPNHDPIPNRPEDFRKEVEGAEVNDLHAAILRELDEPRDGYEPVPVWLIFIFFALLGWGGWYLGAYSGGWSATVYDERVGGAVAPDGDIGEVDLLALGRRVYNNCASCHQASGQGVRGQYPPLVDSEFVKGSPHILARIVLNGMHGPVEVGGVAYNNVMPAWEAMLTDDQIAAVLTYVRAEFGGGAPEVTPELVGEVRTEVGRREAWTAQELMELATDESR